MKRIDRETVQRILDSADIVEVVSDFVTLKRRGANYIGLCPFHNERTPSFSVSKSKGICKCFSCGKGGSPVNFVMEHEQMSFNEALRYLAAKYHIEIKEQELTDQERQADSDRENMLALNAFAMQHFEDNLLNTSDGRDIGYAYFRERGISDAAISKFHLGYALEKSTELYQAATSKGYNEKFLADTGLCIHTDNNRWYDRFKGRVIYPVFSISGKVLAFGGRTLRNDKTVAKYVNSPESIIYSKSRELYGLYQAKHSIARKNKCILVEGYMDVISMSQSGVENVVASSGTSLTEGQIRLIHRFTENVTVIYDSDAAGIKASLRGIDMLLAEGLNIKVVLLPDGDDPDSFAQNHTATEVEEYLAQHETDFIRFKTAILLDSTNGDPLERSRVINDIVRSISVIPDEITRSVYIKECSRSLDIDEKVLTLQTSKLINERREKSNQRPQTLQPQTPDETPADNQPTSSAISQSATVKGLNDDSSLYPFERELVRYAVRYGMLQLSTFNEDGSSSTIDVVNFIKMELEYEQLQFTNQAYAATFNACIELADTRFKTDYEKFTAESSAMRAQQWNEGIEQLRQTADNLDQIKNGEKTLNQQIDEDFARRDIDFRTNYAIRQLVSSPDDTVRQCATQLASSRYKLSKVHSKYARLETEADRLNELLPIAIFGLKNAIAAQELRQAKAKLSRPEIAGDMNAVAEIMTQIKEINQKRSQYARYLGDRVVAPK
jgi:DNA primase